MSKWLGTLLSLWIVAAFLAVVMVPASGCGKEFGNTIAVSMQAGAETLEKLEKSGVNHDAELYVPIGLRAELTTVGFTIKNPGGYLRIRTGRGRGLGARPSDAGPPPPVGDE